MVFTGDRCDVCWGIAHQLTGLACRGPKPKPDWIKRAEARG